MTTDSLKAALTALARDKAGIPTLEFRHRDSLDFHDLSVGTVRRLLLAAYRLGHAHGTAGPADAAPPPDDGTDLWEGR